MTQPLYFRKELGKLVPADDTAQAALAPFTETEEGSDTSGLRLCAIPESTPPNGEDHG